MLSATPRFRISPLPEVSSASECSDEFEGDSFNHREGYYDQNREVRAAWPLVDSLDCFIQQKSEKKELSFCSPETNWLLSITNLRNEPQAPPAACSGLGMAAPPEAPSLVLRVGALLRGPYMSR